MAAERLEFLRIGVTVIAEDVGGLGGSPDARGVQGLDEE